MTSGYTQITTIDIVNLILVIVAILATIFIFLWLIFLNNRIQSGLPWEIQTVSTANRQVEMETGGQNMLIINSLNNGNPGGQVLIKSNSNNTTGKQISIVNNTNNAVTINTNEVAVVDSTTSGLIINSRRSAFLVFTELNKLIRII